MARARGIQLTAAVFIIVGVAALAWQCRTPRPAFEAKPHQALGQVAAEETVKLLGPQGRVILFVRDFKIFDVPATETQCQAFCAAIKAGGKTIAITNLIQLDPLRSTGVPPDGFVDALQRARDGDVIVSLLGPPNLSAAQLQKLKPKQVKVVALCSGNLPRQINLKVLFERQLLNAAILSLERPLPRPAGEAPARKWFESFFQVITPDKLSELPLPP